ncbi:MAG: hypothetical protein ACREX9_02515, partial [Gammaproteobacteria bacterium]
MRTGSLARGHRQLPPFGGTCALGGCDPKKVLVGAAEALDRLDGLEDRGVRRGGPRIEWRDLMRFKG